MNAYFFCFSTIQRMLVFFFMASLVSLLPIRAFSNGLEDLQEIMPKLEKGKVVILEEPPMDEQLEDVGRVVVARILIDRPQQSVWNVISQTKTLFSGDKHMKKVRIIRPMESGEEIVEYTLRISRFVPAFVYTTKNHYFFPDYIEFHRVSGSFKDFKGYSRLTSVDEGQKTVLTYSLWIDTGYLIPQFVIRQFLKQSLPGVLTHIKNRVYKEYPVLKHQGKTGLKIESKN